MQTTIQTAVETYTSATTGRRLEETGERRFVVDYYDTLELILAKCRKVGEFRTHFGPIGPQKEDYCFLKNVMIADPLSPAATEMRSGMDLLHKMIFDQRVSSRDVRSILDFGCGVGGTMKKLAQEARHARVDGVNLNRTQVDIGRRFLEDCPNTRIIHSDILDFGSFPKYDLIYMIESAFHILDKKALVSKIASLLKPGGTAIVVDVFVAERFEKRFRHNEHSELFHYWPVQTWMEEFGANGGSFERFNDISEPVANYCRVTTPIEDLFEIYAAEFGASRELEAEEKYILAHIHDGYSRLSKMLKRGFLRYGIISFKKVGWQ